MRTIESLDELTDFVSGREAIYLRVSHGPQRDAESGRSRDFEAGVDLPGWSVTTVAPEPWWPRPSREWVARRLCKYVNLAEQGDGRYPWLLTGRVVGYGPDHEPLVTDIVPVAAVSDAVVDEAKSVYHKMFDVGRDSTQD
ncbi:DUF6098 family protein [Nocardia goodfellowii]|uniref:Uncharacterized protein n=1 Tax=Nocardia goodfellowii TaxID=882446 RepID=A0ABS4QGS0_9NOCA|nr:DUF6098 family protein [Nocardia goodfellowii]MBP2190890.1 hypothetical protein [Nocardia goodfellowii]